LEVLEFDTCIQRNAWNEDRCSNWALRANTSLGKLIITNINYLQLTAGFEEPVLMATDNLSYISNNWLLHRKNGDTLAMEDEKTKGK
jgi:hypothetical protein